MSTDDSIEGDFNEPGIDDLEDAMLGMASEIVKNKVIELLSDPSTSLAKQFNESRLRCIQIIRQAYGDSLDE